MLEEAHRIERSFRFRNFQEALTFAQEIGELAEAEGHHPNISFGWGNATVSLQTKKIKGLHENDFIMATKIDRITLAPTLALKFWISLSVGASERRWMRPAPAA